MVVGGSKEAVPSRHSRMDLWTHSTLITCTSVPLLTKKLFTIDNCWKRDYQVFFFKRCATGYTNHTRAGLVPTHSLSTEWTPLWTFFILFSLSFFFFLLFFCFICFYFYFWLFFFKERTHEVELVGRIWEVLGEGKEYDKKYMKIINYLIY